MKGQMKHCLDTKMNRALERLVKKHSVTLRNLLIELRQSDTEQFEWLCKEFGLEIKYSEDPQVLKLRETERWQRTEAAKEKFHEIQVNQIRELREKIAQERQEFNRIKEEELVAIYSGMKELGAEVGGSLEETLESLGVETYSKEKAERKALLEKMQPVLQQMAQVRKYPENSDADLP